MFCIKCGANNPNEAVYCLKCGAQFDREEETRVAARDVLTPVESEPIFSVTPTMMFVKLGYVLTVIAAFLLVAILAVVSVPWTISVLLGLLLLLIPGVYHFKQKLIRYTLTDSMIEIDKGLISRTTQNVPLRRVQDVTVSSSMVQRIFRFGDILIDNASEQGGKVVLKNIDSPRKYADILLKQMRQLER
jgi:uncharacterized membrane protein YdbT with pleckstrin-like domain